MSKMSRYFLMIIISFIFGIHFVVYGYSEISDNALASSSAMQSFKTTFQMKLSFRGEDQLTECDCGDLGTCSYIEGKNVCKCFERAAEFNGNCEECDCGLGACIFTKNGDKTCECIPAAAVNNGTCEICDCGAHGKCTFKEGAKTCTCDEKFANKKGTCEECNCGAKGKCSFDNSDEKNCICETDHVLNADGICYDPCTSGICKNDALCSIEKNNFRCYCTLGYNGTTCDEEVDELHVCDDNPCQNGGDCFKNEADYICKCKDGFFKTNCTLSQWCKDYGMEVCGRVPCVYDGDIDKNFCSCKDHQTFDPNKKICKDISKCLKIHLDGYCLTPHEMCSNGICLCESDYTYTENYETCVRENMCTAEDRRRRCSELSAICVEDSFNETGFKCVCENGYVEDKSQGGKCIHKCRVKGENEKCFKILGLCELDRDYNTACNCPLLRTKKQENCDKMAEFSYIGVFQILRKPYEVFHSQDRLKSSVDYIKLTRDFNDSFTFAFRLYQGSNILNCKESSTNMVCSVELQFKKQPGEELNMIFSPSVCLPMRKSSTYCLLPPRLILQKNVKTFKKMNPCDEIIANTLCGPSATCQVSGNNFYCKCKPGFDPTGAYKFAGDSESVIEKCNDIDECLEVTACPNTTYCVNSIGSFECFCKGGFRTKANKDIKVEGCAEVCNPNPCVHGTCNITGSDGFICNCESSYTGFTCNEPNLLIADEQESSRKNLFVIGGTLGALLLVAVIVCVNLIRKIKEKSTEEDDAHKLEIHRKRGVKSHQALDGASNVGEYYENTVRDPTCRHPETDTILYAYPKVENGQELTIDQQNERSRHQRKYNDTSKATEFVEDRRNSSHKQNYRRDHRQYKRKDSRGSEQRVHDQDYSEGNQGEYVGDIQAYDRQEYVGDNMSDSRRDHTNECKIYSNAVQRTSLSELTDEEREYNWSRTKVAHKKKNFKDHTNDE